MRSEARSAWRLNWLNAIRELSDLAGQKHQWLNPSQGNPHFSYVEYICSYFDNCVLSDSYETVRTDGFVTDAEVQAVSEFDRLLREYSAPNGDEYDHDAILSDPRWIAIADAARHALQRLRPLIADSYELAVFK